MAGDGKGSNDDMILFALAAALIGGISYVVWMVFSTELISFLRWIRVGELHLVGLILGDDYAVNHSVAGPQYLGRWRDWLGTADPDNITFDYIKVMTQLAVLPMKWVFVVLLSMMAIWSIFKGPGTYFRRKMGLEDLMVEQSKSFPYITPFLKVNPNKLPNRPPGDPVPARLPMFAEALAPEEWVAHHGITFEEGKLDYAMAYRALAKQLGPRWQGPEKLPLYARGLYAACALKSLRKRKASDDLLKEMAKQWDPKKGFQTCASLKRKIDGYIKDPKITGALNKVTRNHAFQTTAMLRALQRAREEGGVMASAAFVWLRAHDRTLWYPLNNLGRRSYHAEAAGAVAHYTNELIATQRIPSPRFDDVIKVIEKTLTGPDARKVPPRVT